MGLTMFWIFKRSKDSTFKGLYRRVTIADISLFVQTETFSGRQFIYFCQYRQKYVNIVIMIPDQCRNSIEVTFVENTTIFVVNPDLKIISTERELRRLTILEGRNPRSSVSHGTT